MRCFWTRSKPGGEGISKDIRINNKIRAREVRLIDADGTQVGVVPTTQALDIAKERDLDLVEVSPNTEPPVCKIMDFGKYKYQMSKKISHKKGPDTKEVKLRPRIGDHDLELKVKNLRKFIDQGHKAKISMMFRGRERAKPELGMKVFEKMITMIPGEYQVVQEARMEGNSIVMIIAPK